MIASVKPLMLPSLTRALDWWLRSNGAGMPQT